MIEIDRIYNEDCLEGMKRIDDKSVDCIITDLPYGTTACAWDTVIPFDRLWEQYRRITKPNAAIVLFGSEPFSSALVMSNPTMFRHEWIWVKNRGSNFANTVREPFKEHEKILVFSQGKWTYNPIMQDRTGSGLDRAKYNCKFESHSDNYRKFDTRETNQLTEQRVPSSVQYFKTSCGDDHFHPTQKPVSLIEYLVLTYTNKGDLVLDSCMGSGTTAIACIKAKRHFVGFETDEGYFRQAEKRIWEERRQLTLDFEDVP